MQGVSGNCSRGDAPGGLSGVPPEIDKRNGAWYNDGREFLRESGGHMNIQIFGTSRSFDTKKAQRFFSERKIRVQYIDICEKPMSRGEFENVKKALGGWENLLDTDCRDKGLLDLFRYLTDDAKEEKMLENQALIRTPIVRNGRQATVGYAPEVWKGWQ